MELESLVLCYIKVQRSENPPFFPPKASELNPFLQKSFVLPHLYTTSEIQIIISTDLFNYFKA